MKKLAKFWENNKSLLLFVFLMLFFRSAIADWYHVPSGSMKPTILIGDRVWVDKLAYDIKLPMTDINFNRHSEPQRGDVIVFNSKVSNNRLIKRVVGIPGDHLEMKNNQLYINQQPLKLARYRTEESGVKFFEPRQSQDFLETQLKQIGSSEVVNYVVRISAKTNYLASFSPLVVPEGYLWVMGDNRDNSADSRVIGLVPRQQLVGKAKRVVISFDKNNYYLPRRDRYLEKL